MRATVTFAALVALLAAGCGGPHGEGAEASAAGLPLEMVTTELVTTTSTTTTPPPAPSAAIVVPPERAPTNLPTTVNLDGSPSTVGPFTVATAKPERTFVTLYDAPDGAVKKVELIQTNPEYFGNPRTFLVSRGGARDNWLEVLVQTRPNHTTAWIKADDVTLSTITTQVHIDLSDRRLVAYDGKTVVADTAVVVGSPSTPTPLGLYFVSDRTRFTNTAGAYGPFALGLNGFSEALATFDGALPQTALHGTNQPQLIGQARSNGCIRIPNDVVSVLAEKLPLGTPVLVEA
jgi:lipoprotein-anchoring transpeptidase ErfK/SrfK